MVVFRRWSLAQVWLSYFSRKNIFYTINSCSLKLLASVITRFWKPNKNTVLWWKKQWCVSTFLFTICSEIKKKKHRKCSNSQSNTSVRFLHISRLNFSTRIKLSRYAITKVAKNNCQQYFEACSREHLSGERTLPTGS